MNTNTIRKHNISKERVLALDELLPKRSTQYDSSPGVYVRSDKDRELDILWQGEKVNSKEKAPSVYLSVGFITGALCMLFMTMLFNFGNPSNDNMSDINLWKKANTKPATVSVAPSTEITQSNSIQTSEYTVRSGDSLEKIAYRFYGTGSPSKIDRIQVYNNLKNAHRIRIGQKLTIPLED